MTFGLKGYHHLTNEKSVFCLPLPNGYFRKIRYPFSCDGRDELAHYFEVEEDGKVY